jgi:hypothetical protein
MFGKGVGRFIQPHPVMYQLRNLIGAKKFMAIAGWPAKRLQQPNTHQHGYFIWQKSQEIRRLIHIKAGRQAGHRSRHCSNCTATVSMRVVCSMVPAVMRPASWIA